MNATEFSNKKAQAAALWIIIAIIIVVAIIVIAYYYSPAGNRYTNNTTNNTTEQNCTNLYFFDENNLTENTACIYTQFCGDYMYQGLMTFTNLSDCQASLTNLTNEMNNTMNNTNTTNTTNQTTNTTNTTSNTTIIPATYSVAIADFSFTPQNLTINSGDEVTWTNNGPSQHTVTSDSGEFESAVLAVGNTYTHTFTTAGTFPYHCSIHPTLMTGAITVLSNGTTS